MDSENPYEAPKCAQEPIVALARKNTRGLVYVACLSAVTGALLDQFLGGINPAGTAVMICCCLSVLANKIYKLEKNILEYKEPQP